MTTTPALLETGIVNFFMETHHKPIHESYAMLILVIAIKHMEKVQKIYVVSHELK
jgi:hypothetical protein